MAISLSPVEAEKILSDHFSKEAKVLAQFPLAGGCINSAAKIKTNAGTFFMKWNNARKFPGMFQVEALGLGLLKDSGAIQVPEVITVAENHQHSFLFLEYIEQGVPGKNFWEVFGQQLGSLHKVNTDAFGLNHHNYIGSLYQRNFQHNSWEDFFILERLEPQLILARDHQLIGPGDLKIFESFFKRIPQFFKDEKSSLIHGDLWNGNYLVTKDGNPCIFDPAVYYGIPEMDLGMTMLFGGFPKEFYDSYSCRFPLNPDWQIRSEICNLYPLLVHVNLFGSSYLSQIRRILSRNN